MEPESRLMLHPAPKRPELDELIKRACAAYDALPPERQREMDEAQRRSWVIGELMLAHPAMTRDQALELYNKGSSRRG